MCTVKYAAAVWSFEWSRVLNFVSRECAGKLLLIVNKRRNREFQLHDLFQGGCFSLLPAFVSQCKPALSTHDTNLQGVE